MVRQVFLQASISPVSVCKYSSLAFAIYVYLELVFLRLDFFAGSETNRKISCSCMQSAEQ